MRNGDGAGRIPGRTFAARFAPLLLALVLLAVYLLGLHPGVDAGDSAELQLNAPLLGICHPPGYPVEITIGRLWILLPFGGSIAWRMNLLMAVMGVLGCLALYGSVRRITGQVLPGAVSALLLGLSGVYWSHCLVAEAYVFYGAFLLIGLYAAVRAFDGGGPAWLLGASLFVGIAVWDRPSELFVLPAFGILGYLLRDRLRLTRKGAAATLALFILPFVFSVGCYLVRNQPGRLALRDDAQRDEILQDVSKEISRGYGPHPTALGKIGKAAGYCLGLNWTTNPRLRLSVAGRSLVDYASMLTGAGVFGVRSGSDEQGPSRRNNMGTSIGLAGLILAVAAARVRKRHRAWVAFGLALFGGNLLFVLWHHSWDNMTFTVPGVAGLAILAGLGLARGDESGGGRFRHLRTATAAAAVLFLLLVNFTAVGRKGESERSAIAFGREVASAPWPGQSVILCSYWPAMTFRYVLYIEGGRRDVQVLCAAPSNYMKLIRHFTAEGRSVFLLAAEVAAARREGLARATQPGIESVGFLLANPTARAQGR